MKLCNIVGYEPCKIIYNACVDRDDHNANRTEAELAECLQTLKNLIIDATDKVQVRGSSKTLLRYTKLFRGSLFKQLFRRLVPMGDDAPTEMATESLFDKSNKHWASHLTQVLKMDMAGTETTKLFKLLFGKDAPGQPAEATETPDPVPPGTPGGAEPAATEIWPELDGAAQGADDEEDNKAPDDPPAPAGGRGRRGRGKGSGPRRSGRRGTPKNRAIAKAKAAAKSAQDDDRKVVSLRRILSWMNVHTYDDLNRVGTMTMCDYWRMLSYPALVTNGSMIHAAASPGRPPQDPYRVFPKIESAYRLVKLSHTWNH